MAQSGRVLEGPCAVGVARSLVVLALSGAAHMFVTMHRFYEA